VLKLAGPILSSVLLPMEICIALNQISSRLVVQMGLEIPVMTAITALQMPLVELGAALMEWT